MNNHQSEIEKLIQELCSGGVSSHKLDDVILSLKTGLNPRKNFRLNEDNAENYYVTIREIVNNKIVFSPKTDKVTGRGILH